MPSRQVSKAPELPGYRYIELIGSGGYADVFLYEQQMPSRRVAIKVLDPGAVPAGAVADYAAEANLMARVSAHPNIVQVFEASVAPDGRPYLAMEYYPGSNFHDRARREQISVAEALRVGVQLASAVETAHRAGVLHRDIKPANVLTSEYRRPGLTDFGIASVQGPATGTAEALSIPWSPPEAFGDRPVDRRADVYSLAATVYTLLAGRSPFEVKGGDNRALALISRIEHQPPPPTGRADVPSTLERVLAGAMAKDPAMRPATAADLGRQLQSVESELQLAVTVLELADEYQHVRSRGDHDVDDDRTRVKGVVEVRAQEKVPTHDLIVGPPQGHRGPNGSPVAAGERRREGILAEPEVADTLHQLPLQQHELPPLEPPRGLPRWWLAVAALVLVVAGVIGIALLTGGDGGTPKETDEGDFDAVEVNDNMDDPIVVVDPPPVVGTVTGVDAGDGRFAFTWPNLGDDYSYAVTPDGAPPQEVHVAEYIADVPCIEVEVIALDGTMSAPTRGCAG
jgi:hypothetical protein